MRAPPWRDNVRAYVMTVLYHIYYINPDVRHDFLIDGYGKFLSLSRTISYLRTITVHDILISVHSLSVSTLDLIPFF